MFDALNASPELGSPTRGRDPGQADPGLGGSIAPLLRRNSRTIKALIVLAATVLIALTWGFTDVSIRIDKRETQSHAEGNVSNLALAVEWQLNRQLAAIGEVVQLLAAQWRADPAHFDPGGWNKRSSLLGDVSLRVTLLDQQGRVTATTAQGMVGMDLGDRDYFIAQRDSRHIGLFLGPAILWKTTGKWEMNLSRRLERPDGAFAGVLVVSYDPWGLTNMLEQVDLGPRGLLAMVGNDGAIRALISPYDVRPGTDVSGTAMDQAIMATDRGVWSGPSAPDGVERVHAFRRLRDQDLTIVIGVDRALAFRDSHSWADIARAFAAGVSVLVAGMAALLLREVSAGAAREERLSRDRAAIGAAYAEAEAAHGNVEAKNEQLEGTLAGMSDGVMLLDPDLRLLQWNDRFPDFTGVPRELLRPGTPMEAMLRAQALGGEFGDVEPEAEVARRMRRLREGHPGSVAFERTRPDGSSLELRRSALPGGGFVTLYTDITARKRTEEAQAEARRIADEATEEKARFVTIVSHEIRSPLNAVVNSLDLLDRSYLSSAQRRLASTARQAGDALLDLVHDILEMSKMDSGHLVLRPVVFDLREMLAGVSDMLAEPARARGIAIGVEVSRDIPSHLRADAGRLRQVMTNFVDNAAKFSRPGPVTIRATTTLVAGRPALLLAVADQGPRIAQRDVKRLFQPFSRLGNARDAGTPGTGLGLAICERLTRLMGGQIGLGPSDAGGNEFWVTLPLEPATPEVAPGAGDLKLPRSRRGTVLLVEDIEANQLVTAMMLRRQGHRVDVAESGFEAIRLASGRPYDLVFMDLLMPGMSGFEAARRIRALPGHAGHTPIVALTANTAPEDRARCLEAGMDDMVGKPVRSDDLTRILARTDWPRRASPSVVTPAAVATESAAMCAEDGSLVDLERLDDLKDSLSPTMLASLMTRCLADIADRLPALHDAAARGDPVRAEAEAHALAGIAGTYALASFDRLMRAVMAAARGGDIAAVGRLAADAGPCLADAEAALRATLQTVAA